MRKANLFLMSLLLCFAVEVGAKIITTAPVPGTQYLIKCLATDHTGYLGDDLMGTGADPAAAEQPAGNAAEAAGENAANNLFE